MNTKLQVWLSERQIYFGRFGIYLIAMSLFFVGYVQADEFRYLLTITAQIVTILFAFDLVPVSLRLEQLGKELREEVGLRRVALSARGGIIFVLFWVVFWIILAWKAGVSPYIYGSIGAVGVIVVIGIKYKLSRKGM